MRRLLSFALVLVMLAALLAGCGKTDQEKLVGVWKGEIDMTETFRSQLGEDTEGLELDKLAVTVVYTFTEEGAYTVKFDEGSLEQTIEGFLQAIRAFMEASFAKKSEEAGLTPEEMTGILGMTAEEFVDAMLKVIEEQDLVGEIAASAKAQGKYLAQDGKLYRSDSVDTQPDEAVYETYTLKGDVLTITGRHGESPDKDDLPAAIYPIILKKSPQE